MGGYNFKNITVVPNATDFVNIVLTRTQRKTPTVVHKGYQISILRKFYMRKVKFTQQTINDKFQIFLNEFPILDDIHPFFGDLMNILYDKDHYKLALGQINNARRLIDHISSDYIRLLKYGDSLYRCKQLKRAALGRMVKVIRRLGASLSYLEQVRQHMSRLPQIDPNTRTLLVCGYPNVGKSSFMNSISRANVDVQPYAFTTKSLFVGHFDYKFLRWQVIDTPGILDHPIEDRNVIEMQSITAMAHLRCSILFFIDISGNCSQSIAEQVNLFESITPLFEGKPLTIVLSKIDLRPLSDLTEEEHGLVYGIADKFPEIEFVGISSVTLEGISTVKEVSCEKLLSLRAELKLKSVKRDHILNRMYVAQPSTRDEIERKPLIPESVLELASKPKNVGEDSEMALSSVKKSEFFAQQELFTEFDPDYQGMDWKKHYTLENDDWCYDVIPEFMDGENISDWVDAGVSERWAELEQEEAELLRHLVAIPENYDCPPLTEEELLKLAMIRNKKSIMIKQRISKAQKSNVRLPRSSSLGNINQFEEHLKSMGINPTKAVDFVRQRSLSATRGRKRMRDEIEDIERSARSQTAQVRRAIAHNMPVQRSGIKPTDFQLIKRAKKLERQAFVHRNRMGKSGPGDNSIPNLRPKHLFSGKRSIGSNTRR